MSSLTQKKCITLGVRSCILLSATCLDRFDAS